MTNPKKNIAENQIHAILQAAITIAADYGLHDTEQDLVLLATKMRDRRAYENRKELYRRTGE